MAARSNSKRGILIWLSYDLGIGGDYDGLYAILDSLDARECGDSLATFRLQDLEHIGDVIARIKREVRLTQKDRVYLISRDDQGRLTGKFIIGKRRVPPWRGYAAGSIQEVDRE